jgi:hypothetical protein
MLKVLAVERVLSYRVMLFVFVLLMVVVHAFLGGLCLWDEQWAKSVVLVFRELVLMNELAVIVPLRLLLGRGQLVVILAVTALHLVVSQHCLSNIFKLWGEGCVSGRRANWEKGKNTQRKKMFEMREVVMEERNFERQRGGGEGVEG